MNPPPRRLGVVVKMVVLLVVVVVNIVVVSMAFSVVFGLKLLILLPGLNRAGLKPAPLAPEILYNISFKAEMV